jgi:hypothetical protein
MATTPSIVNVSPAPDSSGIILKERIVVTFDQEMDRSTINDGTFVLIGPDTSTVFSPIELNPFDLPGSTEEEINSSPYVKGYVKGTIQFSKVSNSGSPIDESTTDYIGSGDSWLEVATFIPDEPLQPNREYTVILAGDEDTDDGFDSGIKTRTVFDTQKISGSGTCEFLFYGGYTGTTIKTFVVVFTSSGAPGVAEYEWWDANDPLVVNLGVASTGERELIDGIMVTSGSDGSFSAGDRFEVVVVPAIVLPNNYRWVFTTGNGNIVVPPSTSSASGIDSITTSTGLTSSSFSVLSISPIERKYGVPISTDPYAGETITIVFSDELDTDSIQGNITVYSESANGDPAFFATGILDYEATIIGDTITISLDPGQLYQNNIVNIKLSPYISSINGVLLTTEYWSYFTTPYSPLYSSLRRIQLDLGSLISEVPEETIMLAILEASLSADANSFLAVGANSEYFEFAKRQYATCLAELILLNGLMGTGLLSDRMSKSLGDLKVFRGGTGFKDKIKGLENCVEQWRIPLSSGGLVTPGTSLLPQVAVKGCDAYDAITVHRQWEPTSGIGVNSVAAGNRNTRPVGRRSLKTFRSR